MPSQTYHLTRVQMEYLDTLCDTEPGLENPSQALKYVLNEYMELQKAKREAQEE